MPDSPGLLRDDRCAIERRHDRIRRGRVALAAALEQHPPFESAGSHVGEALEYPVADIGIFGGYQPHRLDQPGIQPWFTPWLLQENLAIKGPVFRANIR